MAILQQIPLTVEEASIILYNARTVTLTLAVYTFVTRGNYGYAAPWQPS